MSPVQHQTSTVSLEVTIPSKRMYVDSQTSPLYMQNFINAKLKVTKTQDKSPGMRKVKVCEVLLPPPHTPVVSVHTCLKSA